MAGSDLLASPSDLCTRLGREVPGEGTPEYNQLEALLSDASNELRSVIGQPLSKETSTVVMQPDGVERRRRGSYTFIMSWVDLPAVPVLSVSTIIVDGITLTDDQWFVRQRTLFLPHTWMDSELEITYTHGWDPLPPDLVKWTCVLAAAMLNSVSASGALGVTAGVSQHTQAIDDYSESWANYGGSGSTAGLTLPSAVGTHLRSIYGSGGVSTLKFRGVSP